MGNSWGNYTEDELLNYTEDELSNYSTDDAHAPVLVKIKFIRNMNVRAQTQNIFLIINFIWLIGSGTS